MKNLLITMTLLAACGGDDTGTADPHAIVDCDAAWTNDLGIHPAKCEAACKVQPSGGEKCVDANGALVKNAFAMDDVVGGCATAADGHVAFVPCDQSTIGACSSTATIALNHGHVWPSAVLVPGRQEDVHIMGVATHDHVVTVTPALFDQIHDSGSAEITSSSDGTHVHVVVVSCR